MSHALRSAACIAWLAFVTLSFVACSDPQVPPPISLDGPTKITSGSYCLLDDGQENRLRLHPDMCDPEDETTGELRHWSYITNQFGNSLAVVNFNASIPRLVDIDSKTPGVTHIAVGEGPVDAAVSRDGNFIFTLNQVSQDISVVVDDLSREFTTIPVGRSFTHLIAFDDRDALIYLTPDDNTLHEVTWSFTCPGEAPNVYREECEPELTVETNEFYVFPEGWTPRDMVLSEQGHLFATFTDRAALAEILLTDSDEAATTCIDGKSAAPCVVRELGLTYSCIDGIDNDGDGFADAADPQCLTPTSSEAPGLPGRSRATVCNDGEDNDGDGLSDAADPGCTGAGDDSETDALTPVDCPDGFANGDCLSSDTRGALLQPSTECTDGIDNDLDGAFDLDDPACSNPNNTTESQGRFACSDGEDNDGDGLADYPEDPDCYSTAGTTESKRVINAYGPIAIDPEGLFAYVVDRTQSQVLIIDLNDGLLLDANAMVPSDSRVGVAVGRLPLSITARQDEFTETYSETTTNADGEEESVVVRSVRLKVAFANVAATRGVVYYVDAAEYYQSFEGESEEPTEETRNLQLKLRDQLSTTARSTSINCGLSDEVVDRIRIARQLDEESGSGDISCQSVEIPQIERLPSRCLARCDNGGACSDGEICRVLGDDSVCVAGTEEAPLFPEAAATCVFNSDCNPDADIAQSTASDTARCVVADYNNEVLAIVSDETGPEEVNFIRSVRNTFGLNQDNGEVTKETVKPLLDARILDDSWRVIYEGEITQRSDTIVAVTDDNGPSRLILSQGGDFCAAGVEAGDLFTINSDPTPLNNSAGGAECSECGCYRDVDLMYRIDDVQGNQLVISVIPEAEHPALNRDDDTVEVATVLPSRDCFAAGLTISIRPQSQWVVRGERAGLLVNSRASSGVCVPRYDWDGFRFRALPNEEFKNPYFAFEMSEGSIIPPQGFEHTFRTTSGFRSLSISAGPSTTDIKQVDTSAGSYLPVLDASTNLVRVYDANSLRLLNVLF